MAKPKKHNVDFTATKKVKEPTEVDPHSPVLLIHTRLEVMDPKLRGEGKI